MNKWHIQCVRHIRSATLSRPLLEYENYYLRCCIWAMTRQNISAIAYCNVYRQPSSRNAASSDASNLWILTLPALGLSLRMLVLWRSNYWVLNVINVWHITLAELYSLRCKGKEFNALYAKGWWVVTFVVKIESASLVSIKFTLQWVNLYLHWLYIF